MQLANHHLNPEILQSLHYSSIEEAGLDMLLLSAQAKYSEYLMENQYFEKKYQTDFLSFEKIINQQIGKEDFEQEDDLMAWRFAYENFRYWKEQIEELKSCFLKY
jgi:hypothetical protein